MKIQIFEDGTPVNEPTEWPGVLCEDEPLAEPDLYHAVNDLEVGEEVLVDNGPYSVRRVE